MSKPRKTSKPPIDVAAMKADPAAPAFRCSECEDTGLVHFRETEKGPRLARECMDCPTYHEAFIAQFGPSSGIPGRHLRGGGFGSFIARSDDDKALQRRGEAYVAGFTRNASGMLLYGPPGTGKTFFAAAIAVGVLNRRFRPKWWNVPEVLAAITATFGKEYRGDESEASILEDAQGADLLVLDDLGANKETDWALKELFLFINKRIEENMPTLITTNMPEKRWEEAFGSRIADRLYELAPKQNRIAVRGASRRSGMER